MASSSSSIAGGGSSAGQRSTQAGSTGGSQAKEGQHAHQLLVKGDKLSLRRWIVNPGDTADDASASRSYVAAHDSVLYCQSGSAECHIEGSVLQLRPGDSWSVPSQASHTYKVTSQGQPFVAIEACHPAAP